VLGKIPRPSPALVIACLALAVALSGASYAAVVIPRNSVGSLQLKANSVNSSKVANGSLLRADFRSGQIPAGPPGPAGPAGPAGAAGPAGPAGAAGASATSLWASVDSSGSLVRNKGVASSQKLGTGDYLVTFNQDVTNCVYQATLGGPTTGLWAGQVTAAQRVNIAAGVRVVTQNSTGVTTDFPFFLSVFC
jgi:hypothetical protein